MKFLLKSRTSVLKTFTKTVSDLLAVAEAEEHKAGKESEKAVRLAEKSLAAANREQERLAEAKQCRDAAAQLERLLPVAS